MGRCAWLLLAALVPGPALAHPLDEVVQGAYLTLSPGEVRLELDLTPGPLVVGGILKALDANGDQTISDAERRAYGAAVLKQSRLTLDGAAGVWRVDRVTAPTYANVKQGDVIKIYAVAARPDRLGAHKIAYENRYVPAKSQCVANVFLLPSGNWRYQVTGQKHSDDGRGLTVDYVGVEA